MTTPTPRIQPPYRVKDYSTLAELCNKEPAYRHLMGEWNVEKNRNFPPYGITLTPYNVTPQDGKLVWWKCPKGHNWNASVSARVQSILEGRPDGCIFCRRKRIQRGKTLYEHCLNTPEEDVSARKLLEEWDYEKNAPLTPKDVRPVAYQKVWWKCSQGHSFQQLISNRVKAGVGCPYCGHRKVLPGFNDLATLFPEIAQEWDTQKNGREASTAMPMSGATVWWKCPQGHSYSQRISTRIRKNQGCPYCAAQQGKKHSPLVPGVNDLATTHPQLLPEWNYERNTFLPSEIKAGSKKQVWWKCKNGHEWSTPAVRRTGKRPIGCPHCYHSKALPARFSE